MFAVPEGPLTRDVWMRYALVRIQELVDKPLVGSWALVVFESGNLIWPWW